MTSKPCGNTEQKASEQNLPGEVSSTSVFEDEKKFSSNSPPTPGPDISPETDSKDAAGQTMETPLEKAEQTSNEQHPGQA